MFERWTPRPGVAGAAGQVGVPKRPVCQDSPAARPRPASGHESPRSHRTGRQQMPTKVVCRFPGIFYGVELNLRREIVKLHDVNVKEFEIDGPDL